ncbi:MAG: hypothetical protein WKH64_06590 [Chloroflexia bacterium]
MFGELIDQSDGRGNDTAAVRWQMGEDLPIGDPRHRDPTAFNDPDGCKSQLLQRPRGPRRRPSTAV